MDKIMKLEVGRKYKIFNSNHDKKMVGTIEVLSRTAKFITYHDDFMGRTKKQKIEERNNQEFVSAFYIGVFAGDRV